MSTTALDNERWGAGERNGASPGGQLALGQVRPDWERLEVARRSERKAAAAASHRSTLEIPPKIFNAAGYTQVNRTTYIIV